MRLYILKETELAYLLKSISFKERWIPKIATKIDLNTKRMGAMGISYEIKIEPWALKTGTGGLS